jgi:hypothetical protein
MLCPKVELDACKKGAASFLASLKPLPEEEEPAHLLLNALDLVGHLRVREDEALQTLRDWICHRKLLERSVGHLELHRAALYALAAAQERGKSEDEGIWKEWLKPREEGKPEQAHFFLPAAFSGLALSRKAVPGPELLQLLCHYKEIRNSGSRIPVSPAILALWVGRERKADEVLRELWEAMEASRTPQPDWEIIVRCARRMWPSVRPWNEMVKIWGLPRQTAPERRESPTESPYPAPVSLWNPDIWVRLQLEAA